MSNPTKHVASVVLGVVALALFGRGLAYYWGSGPHDGEDLPSFVTFLAGSAVLLAAVLVWWSAHPRRRALALVGLFLSGVLVLITSWWWWFNLMLERWAG
jgi:drug/metabolite transporter (DMT)-like permease